MSVENRKKNIVIIGLGLLGSSLAEIFTKTSRLNCKVTGVSSPGSVEKALEKGLIEQGYHYDDIEQWLSDADLILLCTPIEHIVNQIKKIAQFFPAGQKTILSDVGSTKEIICDTARDTLPEGAEFIGGHPMAGSEKRGLEAGDERLFENAYWILTPDPGQSVPPFLEQAIRETGSTMVLMNPKEHDDTMAYLSHAPQLVATALAANIHDEYKVSPKNIHLAGRGFRDSTRIAASSFSVWKDIFATNPIAIGRALKDFAQVVDQIRSSFKTMQETGNVSDLQKIFETGAETRMKLSVPGKSFLQGLSEVVVQIDDRPGMILLVVRPLSEAGINVMDIELMKVREGVDGTLLLAFKNQDQARAAIEVLEQEGLNARMR